LTDLVAQLNGFNCRSAATVCGVALGCLGASWAREIAGLGELENLRLIDDELVKLNWQGDFRIEVG
jgi:hypothetical protein